MAVREWIADIKDAYTLSYPWCDLRHMSCRRRCADGTGL